MFGSMPMAASLYETPDTYIVQVFLPGLNPDAIDERTQDVFYQWPLPTGAQSDQIKADYKEEMLTISIPVDAQPKSVQSETSEPKSKSASATAAAA
jgi:HSP20 family molecular chaperone IbpA